MNHVDKRGFTIIELMLAMSFISVLLLGIAMTVIQIGTVYNRGMALKEVNQAAREIGADVNRSLSAAQINRDLDYVPTTSGGRLCLGTVSYIWNTGKAFEDDDPTITWYGNDPSHVKPVHFVKVPDNSKIYCSKDGTGALNYATITTDDAAKANELLPQGDHSLNIHKFVLNTPRPTAGDPDTKQQLYVLDYTIGSGSISAMNDDQSACKSPGEAGADLAYCNVQPFSIVIRAGNKV